MNPSPANPDEQGHSGHYETKEDRKTKTRSGGERKRVLTTLENTFSPPPKTRFRFSNYAVTYKTKRRSFYLKSISVLK
jgi:hypothetical protein